MYGLKLKPDQISNILINKKYDISYLIDTSIRGPIAIINDDYEIIAYANLEKTIKTTFEEHILNQANNSYKKANAINLINELDFTKLRADAYLYHLINVDVLDCPKRINVISETQIWAEFDEKDNQEGYKQVSLFDL